MRAASPWSTSAPSRSRSSARPETQIVCPPTLLHEVRPVRAGVRLVAVTFVESLIGEAHLRSPFAELNDIAALEGLNMRWEQRVRFEAVRANLLRLWSTG